MRGILIVSLTLAAVAGLASANPLCLSNSISFYQTNYTSLDSACQVGDKLFWAFTYTPSSNNATPPSADQVMVSGDGSNPGEPGLIFTSPSTGGWTVNGTATPGNPIYVDSSIGFSVAVIGNLPLIVGASLDFSGYFSIAGQGVADIGETITYGSGSLALEVDSNSGPFTSAGSLPGVSSLSVGKDLIAIIPAPGSGTFSGTATITEFREGFSEIPEPAAMVLTGSGLIGLALLLRRR
ncbi:MAG TPA: hypothetical protein VMH28_15985 [Candidatus Acidoferrales bacterium]|nr:hypothetical protein [Candidatus Acidoferrales bacterium]